MRAWPPRPIMNSTQTHLDSRRNQNGQVLCSMIWLFVSTDVQLVSDISNTTISQASLAWGLKSDKLEIWLLSNHSTLNALCILLEADSRSPQSQCVEKSQVVWTRSFTTFSEGFYSFMKYTEPFLRMHHEITSIMCLYVFFYTTICTSLRRSDFRAHDRSPVIPAFFENLWAVPRSRSNFGSISRGKWEHCHAAVPGFQEKLCFSVVMKSISAIFNCICRTSWGHVFLKEAVICQRYTKASNSPTRE